MLRNQRGHLGIGRNRIREDRDQPMAETLHALLAHIEIEPRDELAIGPGGDEQRLAHAHRFGQRIMRVRGEDDVDALHAARHLVVDVEAVVGKQHHEIRALAARFLHLLSGVHPRAGRSPFREHPARIGDGRVGIGLPDDGDRHAALLKHLPRLEDLVLEFRVADVLRRRG